MDEVQQDRNCDDSADVTPETLRGKRRPSSDVLGEQADLVQSVLDAISVPIFIKDTNLRYISCNKAVEEFLGRSREELIGSTNVDIANDALLQASFELDRPVLEGKGPLTCDGSVTRADGSICNVKIHKALLHGPSGEPRGIISIAFDVSDLANAERSLREAHQFTDTVVSSVGAGIIVYDPDMRILLWNPSMEKLTGLRSEQVLGRYAPDLFPHLRAPEVGALFAQTLAGEVVIPPDLFFTVPMTGRSGWTSAVCAPHRDANGEIIGVISLVQDVSERKSAEELLYQNEQKYRTLFENFPEGLVMMTDVFLDCNDVLCRVFGCQRDDIIGKTPADFSPEYQPDGCLSSEVASRHVTAALCGTPQFFAWQHKRLDGTLIDAEITLNALEVNGKRMLQAIVRDVTEKKHAEAELKQAMALLQGVFNGISDPILLLKPDIEIIRINQAAEWHLGTTAEAAIGRKCYHLRGQEHPCPNCSPLTSAASSQPASRERYDVQSGRWFESNTYPINDESGRLILHVEHIRDISEKKSHQAQLHQMAHYDPLTGLPNRFLFSDRLRQGLENAKLRGNKLAVMFLDIDGFKLVNDTLGHNAGDFLLKQIAARLRATIREEDVIARMGGDEFTVMLPCLRHVQDSVKVAKKILSALAEPFTVMGEEHFLGASIGISVFPGDGEDAESLVKNADTAMYGAKEHGRNTFHLYTEQMNIAVVERVTLGNSLRRALERDEFVLHYQPRVDILTGETLGAESLMRWRRPGIGLVYPGKFIPTAEETGLISDMGEWALRTACLQNKEWQLMGMRPMQIAVNISARQFQRRSLPSLVRKILADTGLDPSWLDLELTESILMENPDLTGSQLARLKNMGVCLSIDDFGTGYSSLSYLQKFPVDAVKIDRSFIRDVTTNPESAAITRAIVAMADSLGLRVVAEGVETLQQVEVLRELGCREIQGYFISRPVASADFVRILKTSGEWLQAA